MPKNISIISTQASKAADKPQKYLFDGFCLLLTRTLEALEEETWAEDTGWDIAFGNTMSEAEAAWDRVVPQADKVRAAWPLSANDLALHRMAGLVKRAVTATDIFVMHDVQTRAMEIRMNAFPGLVPAVTDLICEAEACISEMYNLACASEESHGSILPLAA